MLGSALKRMGFELPAVFKVADRYDATKDMLDEMTSNFYLVLVSGGISVMSRR